VSKSKCEFGGCNSFSKLEANMTNMTTKETRKALICGNHQRTLTDTCFNENMYVEYKLIQREVKP